MKMPSGLVSTLGYTMNERIDGGTFMISLITNI